MTNSSNEKAETVSEREIMFGKSSEPPNKDCQTPNELRAPIGDNINNSVNNETNRAPPHSTNTIRTPIIG